MSLCGTGIQVAAVAKRYVICYLSYIICYMTNDESQIVSTIRGETNYMVLVQEHERMPADGSARVSDHFLRQLSHDLPVDVAIFELRR